jgi:hypothetical protein
MLAAEITRAEAGDPVRDGARIHPAGTGKPARPLCRGSTARHALTHTAGLIPGSRASGSRERPFIQNEQWHPGPRRPLVPRWRRRTEDQRGAKYQPAALTYGVILA